METNIIYNKDCLEGLKELPNKSVQMVITSPPYNMGDERYYKNYNDNKSSKEYVNWLKEINSQIYRVLKDDGVYVLNINYNRKTPYEYHKVIVDCVEEIGFICRENVAWIKQGFPITEKWNMTRDWEYIAILTKSNEYKTSQKVNKVISNKWEIKNNGVQNLNNINKDFTTNINNATFPIELPRKCIKLFTDEGDVVCDPFNGLASTSIACIETKRKYIGFELDKETYEFSLLRLKQETNQKRIPF